MFVKHLGMYSNCFEQHNRWITCEKKKESILKTFGWRFTMHDCTIANMPTSKAV